MKTTIRLTVLTLSLSMLLVAVPAQSRSSRSQVGPALTLQSQASTFGTRDLCAALPRLQRTLAHLETLPQTPFVQFLEKITQAAIDFLVAKGCK